MIVDKTVALMLGEVEVALSLHHCGVLQVMCH